MLQGGLSKINCAQVPRHRQTENLHQGEGGVVRCDPGEVVLQHGQGAGERNVAAAAE